MTFYFSKSHGKGEDCDRDDQNSTVNDGIVSGTSGSDSMPVGYVDPRDGDEIDGADGIDDIIDAGEGDDTIDAGAGNDTVYAGSGNDVVHGGSGNDVIYGDGSLGTTVVADKEVFEWDKLPDPNDADPIDNNDPLNGILTQDTGNVTVTFETIETKYTPVTRFATDEQNVDGIDTGGLGAVDTHSSGESRMSEDHEKATYKWSFDNPVTDVSFRINDIDQNSKITITAYDVNGQPTKVCVELGKDVKGIDLNGSDGTVVFEASGYVDLDKDAASTSALVSMPDNVAYFTITHEQNGVQISEVNITDIYFTPTVVVDGEDTTPGDDTLDGGDGDDVIHGGGGDDSITGGDGSDTVYGDDGDDVIDTSGKNPAFDNPLPWFSEDADKENDRDYVDGGDGNDTITTGDDRDTIFGGAGDDSINGGIDDDWIDAGDGDDYVNDDQGSDTIYGGDGNDTIIAGVDVFSDYEGDDPNAVRLGYGSDPVKDDNKDWVDGGAGDDYIMTGDDDDTIYGGTGNDTIHAGIDDDYVEGGDGDDSIIGGHGSDTIYGGAGNDYINAGDPALAWGYGDDDVDDAHPDNGRDLVYGGDGNDTIFGEDDNDTLYGEAGDDVIHGGLDDDEIYGGDGNDIILGEEGDDSLSGGAGIDLMAGGDGNDTMDGGDDTDLMLGGDGDDEIYGGAGIDLIAGGEGNDLIDGGDDTDFIFGEAGDDTISGGAGIDLIAGGEGNDVIDGGDDTDFLFGEAGDDTIYGGAGNDLIDGGDGADEMHGGDGDDIFIEVGPGDKIDGGAGNNTLVVASSSIVTFDPANPTSGTVTFYDLETLQPIGTADFTNIQVVDYVEDDPNPVYEDDVPENTGGTAGTEVQGLPAAPAPGAGTDGIVSGTAGDDVIGAGYVDADGDAVDGNDAIISGEFGDDDIIMAGAGNDSIDAGAGNDEVLGGEGDDTIFGNVGDDVLRGNEGNDLVQGGAGNDQLSGGADNDTLEGGEGSDTMTGDEGDDLLDGGVDNDFLYGDTGNDTLIGGEGNDLSLGGAGNDQFDMGGRASGDIDLSFGGDDRDVFINVGEGDTVWGGEGGDDFDTLDLRGSGPFNIVYSSTDPDNLSGTVEFLDAPGGTVQGTMDFYEIENIVPCFTPGTLIATPKGERRVEELSVGDRVITRDNGIQEIRWMGAKPMNGLTLAANDHLKPVLIQKGSLGHGLPERDMLVSPNHRVLVNNEKTMLYFEEREVLVAAKHLTGLPGVDVVNALHTTYIHFMFDRHEVVLSDGAWTESFQPGELSLEGVGNAQRNEIYELFPELKTSNGIRDYHAARRTLKKHEARLLAE